MDLERIPTGIVFEGSEQYKKMFESVPDISYKGPLSQDALSFRYYNATEVLMGKTMKEWLKFSVCFWHTFRESGSDPFGAPTISRPWDDGSDTLSNALRRIRVAFEFFVKLGVEYYTFHDVDVAPQGATLMESNENLEKVTDLMLELQNSTGVKLLWGTANLFSHPRYMCGGSTNPDPHVFARAASQVKKAMEVTHKLDGQGFVFWGGREGYQTLLNTDVSKELNHMATMVRMAVDYKKKIGFQGQILIEPKPREPMKHQYDYDAQTVIGFLKTHHLDQDVKLNIEPNHSQLAAHEFEHDIVMAASLGMLGSIDANTGSESLGWDTDEFIMDIRQATLLTKTVVEIGGLGKGGLNFDAKLRRESTDIQDMFIGHVASMDILARGLRSAIAMVEEKRLSDMKNERYVGYKVGIGAKIESGIVTFEELETYCLAHDEEPATTSGKEELFKAVFNQYL